jgi:hypothetical protein
MTMQHEQTSSTVERVENVAADAAGTAKQETQQVVATAKDQFHQLVGEARKEASDRGESMAQRAAERLRDLDRQATSLLEGRSQEAGQLGGYLREAQHRVQGLADRLEQGGAQGMLDDIVQFGRRRPGTFLIAAAGLGFLTARVVRVSATAGEHGAGSYGYSSYGSEGYANGSYGTGQYVTGTGYQTSYAPEAMGGGVDPRIGGALDPAGDTALGADVGSSLGASTSSDNPLRSR